MTNSNIKPRATRNQPPSSDPRAWSHNSKPTAARSLEHPILGSKAHTIQLTGKGAFHPRIQTRELAHVKKPQLRETAGLPVAVCGPGLLGLPSCVFTGTVVSEVVLIPDPGFFGDIHSPVGPPHVDADLDEPAALDNAAHATPGGSPSSTRRC